MDPVEQRRHFEALRREYEAMALDVDDLDPEPMRQLRTWLDEWADVAPNEPGAVILATAAEGGGASARNVLLRGIDDRGLTFFTSYESRKGRELAADPHATLLFSWVPLLRQVHVAGEVHQVDRAESEAYFATRPRGSQLAAWASAQSSVLSDRATLEERFAAVEQRYAGADVPCPPHWGGYRLVPAAMELWQGRPNRMHDRLRYVRRDDASGGWRVERLSP
ncbi:MAG TPA: pyridoxamine 5'-phosphate oxidase [Acidimicrobiales bacterium]